MDSPWGLETRHFFSLTPERIFSAVEQSGYRCTGRCFTLYSMENRVYSVEIEQDSDSQDKFANYRIVKFYRPGRWSKEQILDEHQFISDLKVSEVPVAQALQLQDGSTLGTEKETGLFFSIYPRLGGRTPDEFSNSDLTIIGRLMARLHSVGRSRSASNRIQLNPETYGHANLSFLLNSGKIPRDLQNSYSSIVEEILKIVSPIFAATPMQRIHGDCHRGNLLWGSEGPFWIDFDDMVSGPPVQDMWLLIPDFYKPGVTRDIFLKSYEEFAAFDWQSLRLVEPLRALRYINFAAWIAKRWEDPSFPDAFPQFASRGYWQEQIADLREQLEKITAMQ